ncbi:unnamed protein product [Adineta steineri]|uniref:PNT domain-containing protein n=2 Tax=Adineta steineri TaxID=433720 RepID=A0A813XHT7_9BILA|nr:unnamed protein product [Adineta steineri]
MTTTTSTPNATAMGNGNKKGMATSFSAGDIDRHGSKLLDNKDVTKWTSVEVQHWIKEQCRNYELKKATAEKFEMNGQALALLTKHDFLRRSPDGGEILYYSLQRLINPNKGDSVRLDQNGFKNGSHSPRPKIVELSPDDEESHNEVDASSPKPIIEEPDDPPKIRKSQSHTPRNNFQHYPPHGHPFFFSQGHVAPAVMTMPAGTAAAFFHTHHQQQQRRQGIPEEFIHAQHPNIHPGHVLHPHLFQQYNPMMTARGILIEVMDDVDPTQFSSDGANGAPFDANEGIFMVSINGQRYVMNESQVRQLVTEVYQQQAYQETQQQQQQQQHYQQQQQYFQQQQQHYQQQQQQQQPHPNPHPHPHPHYPHQQYYPHQQQPQYPPHTQHPQRPVLDPRFPQHPSPTAPPPPAPQRF